MCSIQKDHTFSAFTQFGLVFLFSEFAFLGNVRQLCLREQCGQSHLLRVQCPEFCEGIIKYKDYQNSIHEIKSISGYSKSGV